MILIHQTEYQRTLAENDYPENLKNPHKIPKKNQVLEQQAMKIMISIKMAMFSKHFRHKLSSQNTRNGLSEHKDFKLIRL